MRFENHIQHKYSKAISEGVETHKIMGVPLSRSFLEYCGPASDVSRYGS
jgi:hypothetical protein